MEQPTKYFKTPIFHAEGQLRPANVTKMGIALGSPIVVPNLPCIFPGQIHPPVHCKLRITGLNQTDVKSITALYMIGGESYQQTLHGQRDIGDRWESNSIYVSEFLLRHDMPDKFLEQGKGITGLRFQIEYADGKYPSAAPGTVLPEFELFVEEQAYVEQFVPAAKSQAQMQGQQGKGGGKKDNCLLS